MTEKINLSESNEKFGSDNLDEFEKSVKAAKLEYKEEPMDENYKNPIVGIISVGRVKKLLKELKDIKDKKILDVGCEAGYVSLEMIKKGGKVFSFDICQDALINFKKKNKRGRVFLAGAQKMPLRDNIFDYVVCTEVIEHMPRLDLAFEEIKRVLKPKGRFLLTFPNENLRKKLYPLAKLVGINTDIEEEVTLYEYNFQEIMDLAKKKFKIVKKYSWPWFFPLTRFAVLEKSF